MGDGPENPGVVSDQIQPLAYVLEDLDANSQFDPGIDDLKEDIKVRLGDYLSAHTKHGHQNGYEGTHGNAFPVPPGSVDFKFTNEEGRPVNLVTGQVSAAGAQNEDVFSKSVDVTGAGEDPPLSETRGTMFDNLEDNEYVSAYLSKGGVIPDRLTGNDFLKVKGSGMLTQGESTPPMVPDNAAPALKLVSEALLKNRWNPDPGSSPFDPVGDRASSNRDYAPGESLLGGGDASPFATLQKELGKYTKGSDKDWITWKQLTNVGFSLQLKAIGELGPISGEVNPANFGGDISLLPGLAQLGVKRPLGAMLADTAYGAPGAIGGAGDDKGVLEGGHSRTAGNHPRGTNARDVARVKAGTGGGGAAGAGAAFGIGASSFGSYYSYAEQFEHDVLASRVLAGALALAIGLAIKPMQLILSLIINPLAELESATDLVYMQFPKAPGPPVPGKGLQEKTSGMHIRNPIHLGRHSRRATILPSFLPTMEEFGFHIPDNNAGGMDPDGPAGPKTQQKGTKYFRTVERGLFVMYNPLTVIMTPGYYVTVSRELVRDLVCLIAKVAEATQTPAPTVSGAVADVVGMIFEILGSKLMRFVNVMAIIGDVSLKEDPSLLGFPGVFTALTPGIRHPGMIVTPANKKLGTAKSRSPEKRVSAVDLLPDVSDAGMVEHALGGASEYGQAMRTGKTLSVLLNPNSVAGDKIKAVATFAGTISAGIKQGGNYGNVIIETAKDGGKEGKGGKGIQDHRMLLVPDLMTEYIMRGTGNSAWEWGDKGGFALKAGAAGGIIFTSEEAVGGLDPAPEGAANGRIKTEAREAIESYLEAEYMPFYFHDLRTNEIISFHAFLQSLSDAYTAKHASTEAYGRMDPVLVYERTTRNISLSFTVASTNPTDFDAMYLKINKLLTMIYPQWSKGTLLESDNATFVQPFSQIPTASPLIRLRLGDIFKSNYTNPNVARLFGAADEDFDIGDEKLGDFMKEDNNAITRSFKAAGGKGLAGMIKSLSFDWFSQTVWETDRFGARAPKFCKINLTFAPIHDIAPGIDHMGRNRAPVYPVGNAVRSLAGDSDPTGRHNFDKVNHAVDMVQEGNRLKMRSDGNDKRTVGSD